MKLPNRVFVDTSFFKALIDERDDFYQDAISISSRFKKNLASAVKLRKLIFGIEGQTEVVRVLAKDEAEAWRWFLNPWKGSFLNSHNRDSAVKNPDNQAGPKNNGENKRNIG